MMSKLEWVSVNSALPPIFESVLLAVEDDGFIFYIDGFLGLADNWYLSAILGDVLGHPKFLSKIKKAQLAE